jgi:hypothetical protein
MPEDDFEFLGILLPVGIWFFPLLPFVLAVCLPVLAVLRLRVLVRMTLLDFLIFSTALGNLWGLCVREIGWATTEHLFCLCVVTLEGASLIVVGVAWGVRTAESLEQRGHVRFYTLVLGAIIGPATCGGFVGMFMCVYSEVVPHAPFAFGVFLLALVLMFIAARRLHLRAAALREKPTKERLRAMAAENIAYRRGMRRALARRRRKSRKVRRRRIGQPGAVAAEPDTGR